MKDNSLSDEELISLYRQGDEEASGIIFDRYYKVICKIAAAYYLAGGDREDLIQEGRVGLFSAMKDYDPGANARFSTFAHTCINRSMIRAVEAGNRKKHAPLNESVSIDDGLDGEYVSHSGMGGITIMSPEQLFIDNEDTNEMKAAIIANLSDMEKRVFDDLLEGYDYKYIALKNGKSAKSIDNAIQRVRKKVREVLNKEKG